MIARHQHEHEAINAREYPGTRQLCATCDEPTERCEEDGIYTEEGDGPLCVECWHKTPEYILAELRAEAAEVLRKIRADKQPTRRGILICGEMMGKMLQLGWDKEDLDSFEILFWATRDADGRMLPRPENTKDQEREASPASDCSGSP